uniref:Uncharacterized protein n=1 Tax=Panagrolaimus sp. ES5 TaxID=591445 RepID=A0AC34G772_9BILA
MAFVFVAFFVLSLSSWNIYSCIVVHRARNWFERNAARVHPAAYYPYGMTPMQVHVYGSGPSQPAPASTPGTPQGYITDAPPSHYSSSPQINASNPSVYPKLPAPTAPPQEPQGGYVNSSFN